MAASPPHRFPDRRQHPGSQKLETAVVGHPVRRAEVDAVRSRPQEVDGVLRDRLGGARESEAVEDLIWDQGRRRLGPEPRSADPMSSSSPAGSSTVGSRPPTTSR